MARRLWVSLLAIIAFQVRFLGEVDAQALHPGLPSTRAVATREEIQETLRDIEQVVASAGYSGRLKVAKRVEAGLLRQRLAEGDFRTGDRVFISIIGDSLAADSFTVSPSRTILIPNVAEFPLNGVLRSELQGYMTQQLARFYRAPTVVTKAFIRLAVFGDVANPGFYQLPADQLLGAAIMSAGGPTQTTKMEASQVMRGGQVLRNSEVVRDALARGLTLDQFNLQAGDEIRLGTKRTNILETAREVGFALGALGSVGFLLSKIIP